MEAPLATKLKIVGEILQNALDSQPSKDPESLSLLSILSSYETVLAHYNIKPENDLFYYRFLLQLNMDPDKNWFSKLTKHQNLLTTPKPSHKTEIMDHPKPQNHPPPDADDSKCEIPKHAWVPSSSTQPMNGPRNQYHTTWADHHYTTPQIPSTNHPSTQHMASRNQFIDMLEAALQPQKGMQRTVMDVWRKYVTDNRMIYIGHNVAMSKAATYFEDRSMIHAIRTWRHNAKERKTRRNKNEKADHLHQIQLEKRIVCRWKLYVKYAKRYRKCLKRTKQWYLYRLMKQCWRHWYRQYLYYTELYIRSKLHCETILKEKIWKEWRDWLKSNDTIHAFHQKQYFKKWIHLVQRNRIPILRKASQINAMCIWTERSFGCNVITAINKMKAQQNRYNVNTQNEKTLCGKQIAMKIQNDYGLVWKSTRINQIHEMIAIYERYYGVYLHFKHWNIFVSHAKSAKREYFRNWRFVINHWKHQRIVSAKYERRNALRNAFQIWRIRYYKERKWQGFEVKILRVRQARLIRKYCSIWTLNLMSVLFYKNKLKTNVIRTWKRSIKHRNIETMMEQQSVLYRTRVLLNEALNQWKAYLTLHKMKREHSLHAMLFHDSHLLLKALNRWKESKQMMDEIRIKYNQILVRNENKRMQISFKIWYRLYVFRTKMKNDMEISMWYHRVQSLSQSVSFWRHFVTQNKKKREAAIHASISYDNALRQKAYGSWKQMIAIRDHQLKLSIRYEMHLERKRMIQTFENWQKGYQRIKMNEYVDEYYINQTLRSFMLQWKIGAEIEMESSRQSIQMFREKYDLIQRQNTKIYCFTVWIQQFQTHLDLNSKLCQFEIQRDIKTMRGNFNLWRDITAQYIKHHTICNQCAIQLNHAQIVYFLRQWQHSVFRKNDLYQKQQYLIMHHRRNIIQSSLTHWRDTVTANQDKYTLLQHSYRQIQSTQTLKYFEQWRMALLHSRMYHKLSMIHRHKSILFCFHQWQQYHQYIIQHRHSAHIMRAKHHQNILIQSIAMWKSEFVRIQNTKIAFKMMRNVQKQHRFTWCMQRWKVYTYCKQTKQRANAMYKIAMCHKVWKQWNAFCQIMSAAKLHETYVYRFRIHHMVRNHFSQWRFQLNLIKIQRKLTARFQHQRVSAIFMNWKAASEDLMNVRNKAKTYYDQRCKRIKTYYFVLWDRLFQHQQSKKTHIAEWILQKNRNQCLLFMDKWRCFVSETKQYDAQINSAKLYYKHKLLRKGLQIFQYHHSLHRNMDKMDDDALYFRIQSTRKHALSIWAQFLSMNRKQRNLEMICLEYKLYSCVAFWRTTYSVHRNLRSMERTQRSQSVQHVTHRTFGAWHNLWSNIVKSKQFRKTSLSQRYLKAWILSCAAKQIEVKKQIHCVAIVRLRHLWMRWSLVLSERHQLFETAMLCHQRRQFNLMRECYTEWSIQFTLQSKCKHVMDGRTERNTYIIFSDWFYISYTLRINRRALTHYNHKTIRSVWQKWKRSLVVYQAKNQKAIDYYRTRITPKLLKYNVISWKMRTQQYRSTKIMVSIVTNHRNQQYIQMTVQKWRVYKQSQTRLRIMGNTIRCKHAMSEMSHVFVEWLYQYMMMRHIKQVCKRKHTELIRNCFVSWNTFHRQEKALRAKTSFIRMELRTIPHAKWLCEYKLGNIWKHVRSPIFRHFLSWQISAQETKKREKHHKMATYHHQITIYRRWFAQWRSRFNDAMLIHKALDYHETYLIRIAWIEWKSVHCDKQNEQQLSLKASLFYNKQLLLREVNAWRIYHQRNKCLQHKGLTLIKLMNDRKMNLVLMLWTKTANQLNLHRKQTWASYEFRAVKLKKKCFVIWSKQYGIQSSLRRRELEFVSANGYKLIHKVFYNWCNTYNGIIYKMDLLESHYNEICNYRLAKYFTLWISIYDCVRSTQERYLLCKIFTDWKHVTKRRKQFKKEIVRKPYILYE